MHIGGQAVKKITGKLLLYSLRQFVIQLYNTNLPYLFFFPRLDDERPFRSCLADSVVADCIASVRSFAFWVSGGGGSESKLQDGQKRVAGICGKLGTQS